MTLTLSRGMGGDKQRAPHAPSWASSSESRKGKDDEQERFMDSDPLRRAFTCGDLLHAPAIPARHGTSLLPAIPADSLWLATAHEPAPQCPRDRRSR
jgi:hypothetical protein